MTDIKVDGFAVKFIADPAALAAAVSGWRGPGIRHEVSNEFCSAGHSAIAFSLPKRPAGPLRIKRRIPAFNIDPGVADILQLMIVERAQEGASLPGVEPNGGQGWRA